MIRIKLPSNWIRSADPNPSVLGFDWRRNHWYKLKDNLIKNTFCFWVSPISRLWFDDYQLVILVHKRNLLCASVFTQSLWLTSSFGSILTNSFQWINLSEPINSLYWFLLLNQSLSIKNLISPSLASSIQQQKMCISILYMMGSIFNPFQESVCPPRELGCLILSQKDLYEFNIASWKPILWVGF